MLEKHAIACDMMHGFDWAKWATGKPDGKKRWVQVVTKLPRVFALCAASDAATEIRDNVSLCTPPPPLGGSALRAPCGPRSRPPPVCLAPSPASRAEQAEQQLCAEWVCGSGWGRID